MKPGTIFNVQNFVCLNFAVGKSAEDTVSLVYVNAVIHNGTA